MYKQNKTNSHNSHKTAYKKLKQTGSPELRERLPRGAVKQIAMELDISWIWAFNVISGKKEGDPRIIALALQYVKVEDQKRKRISELMEKNNIELKKIS